MLLYTIMPYQAIFGQDTETDTELETGFSAINGGFVEWTRVNGERRISRVESTDPSVYLQKEYMPGACWPKG